jgi:hypothetical protein
MSSDDPKYLLARDIMHVVILANYLNVNDTNYNETELLQFREKHLVGEYDKDTEDYTIQQILLFDILTKQQYNFIEQM